MAHAEVVQLYRRYYQEEQNGIIGITVNHEWGEPFSNLEKDIIAAERRNEFYIGWFTDPIFFGDYPSTMKENGKQRLPRFTVEQKEILLNSVDFIGLNYYSSKLIR